jgi:hypothetical protein
VKKIAASTDTTNLVFFFPADIRFFPDGMRASERCRWARGPTGDSADGQLLTFALIEMLLLWDEIPVFWFIAVIP